MSLLRLNQLPAAETRQAYGSIVPPRAWEHLLDLDPTRYTGGLDNPECFRVIAPTDRAEVHLRVPAQRRGGDFALSLDLEEAGGGQLELAFIVINNLSGPRFNIDVDDYGNVTLLGTAERNIPEEMRALAAGLGPCQVRSGLRLFGDLLPRLEALGKRSGYVGIQLEPLTYHNAIMYENFGFAYMSGYKRMQLINREFQPGGALLPLLDGRSPFRDPSLARTARGRSWAIHDNILHDFDGQEHLTLKMVKVFDYMANQRTFTATS